MERIITLFKLDSDVLTDEDKAKALLKKMPSRIASAKKSTTLEGEAKVKRVNMLLYLMFGLKVKYGIQAKANQKKLDAVKELMKAMGKKKKPEPEPESSTDEETSSDDEPDDSSSDERDIDEFTLEEALYELGGGAMGYAPKRDRKRLLEIVAVGASEEEMAEMGKYEGYDYQKGTGVLEYQEPTETMYGFFTLVAGGGADLGQEYVKRGSIGRDDRTEDPHVIRSSNTFYKASGRYDPLTLTGWGMKERNWSGGFNERPPKWVTDIREERKRLKTIADAKAKPEPSVDDLTEAVSAVKIDTRSDFEKLKDMTQQEQEQVNPDLYQMMERYRMSEEGMAKIGVADIYGTADEFQEALDRAVSKPFVKEKVRLREGRRETRDERLGKFTGKREIISVKESWDDSSDEEDIVGRPFNYAGRDYMAKIEFDDVDEEGGVIFGDDPKDKAFERLEGLDLYVKVPSGVYRQAGYFEVEDTDDETAKEYEDALFSTPYNDHLNKPYHRDSSQHEGVQTKFTPYAMPNYEGDEDDKFMANEYHGRRARDIIKESNLPDAVGTLRDLGLDEDTQSHFGAKYEPDGMGGGDYGYASLIINGNRFYTEPAIDPYWNEPHKTIVKVFELDEDALAKVLASRGTEEWMPDPERIHSSGRYGTDEYQGEFDTATMKYTDESLADLSGIPSDSDDSDYYEYQRERERRIFRRKNEKVNIAEKAKRQVFIDQMKADGTLRGHLETMLTSSATLTPPDSKLGEKP